MNASHRHTFDTIPWLVNGRIDDEERRTLDEHVRQCAECRAELALQQRLHEVIRGDEPRVDYAPSASLQKLWQRIGDEEPAVTPQVTVAADATARARGSRPRLLQWLAAAVIVEAIGLTIMATMLADRPAPSAAAVPVAPYRTVTVTNIVPMSAALRVVFAPNLTVTEINDLLRQHHLEIVNGPNSRGMYTLAIGVAPNQLNESVPQILSTLKEAPSVLLAEPIDQPVVANQP